MDLLAQSRVTVPAPVIVVHDVPLWQVMAMGGTALLILLLVVVMVVVAVRVFQRDKATLDN